MTDADIIYLMKTMYITQTELQIVMVVVAIVIVAMFGYVLRLSNRIKVLEQTTHN